MEQELANQQALVQVQSAELAKQQEKVAAEEKHVNSKKRLLAQGKTQFRLLQAKPWTTVKAVPPTSVATSPAACMHLVMQAHFLLVSDHLANV